MSPASTLPLSGGTLDRCDERRHDRGWLRRQWVLARLWLLHDDGRLVASESGDGPALMDADALSALARVDADDALFLGVDADERAHFAVQLPADAGADLPRTGLRAAAARWPAADSARFAYASALFAWHRRYRYCPQCGGRLMPRRAGHSLVCEAGRACPEQFPRTDPAVIVVVEHDGGCLLGRPAEWPEGAYSALAGFVEPGESLEEAVTREVREEAGVRVGEVRYHGSQPWPFPHSMMIGFLAHAIEPTIRLGDELEDARWFSVDELAEGYASGRLRAPASISIAHRLLKDWLSMQSGPAAERALAGLATATRVGTRGGQR